MLYRLLYKSRRSPHCDAQEITNILDAANRNNVDADITGVLLYDDHHFIQYVEGPQQSLAGLFELIKVDNRHYDIHLISFSPTLTRIFPSWAMGAKGLSEGEIKLDDSVSAEERTIFQYLITENLATEDRAMDYIRHFARS